MISRNTAGVRGSVFPGSGDGSGSGRGLGGWLLTWGIVLCGIAAVASGATETGSATLAQASGGGGVESMRLSEVGETISEWRLALLISGSVLVVVMLWAGDAIRPGSMQRAGLRNVKPLPAPVWLLSACIAMLAPGLVAAPLSQMEFLVGSDTDSLASMAKVQGIAYLAGIVVAVGLVIMASKAAGQSGLKLHWVDLAVGLGLLLLVFPIVLLSGDLAQLVHRELRGGETEHLAHPMLQMMVDNKDSPWTWVLIASAVIGAPIVEEAVYRGFLQSGLLRLTNHAWISIITAAAVFGTVHALGPSDQSLPWYAAVQVGVLGLCCGAAFERTKRLSVPIAMHAAFNAVNVGLAMWSAS